MYGSQGAELVAMGDQTLQEEGGNIGGGSSWDQFPRGEEGEREGGRKREEEGGREGSREEEGKEGGREKEKEGGRERGKEGGRERGKEGGRREGAGEHLNSATEYIYIYCIYIYI